VKNKKIAILAILLLGTVLASMGLFEPRKAHAFCDASVSGDNCMDQDIGGTDGGSGGGGGSICTKEYVTTCTGPTGVECCVMYHCPSGNTAWNCSPGYCPGTYTSCGS